MTSQKTEFLTAEGDAWYERNRSQLSLDTPMRQVIVGRLAPHLNGSDPAVLEIGCGRGENLAALARVRRIRALGLDPSEVALADGRSLYPGLDLRCGTADALPFEDRSLDVVWFGFCLYLVDRTLLARCVSEADRVLRDDGLICIVDFDPDVPSRRPYHHRPGLWSYKMDYARLFLAHPAYRLVEKASLSHSAIEWHADPQERIGMWLCRKDTANAYRNQ